MAFTKNYWTERDDCQQEMQTIERGQLWIDRGSLARAFRLDGTVSARFPQSSPQLYAWPWKTKRRKQIQSPALFRLASRPRLYSALPFRAFAAFAPAGPSLSS